MSSLTFVGKSDDPVTGPPPPPPPPPPVPGQLPAMRINTVQDVTTKKPQITNNDIYEPPAAIQNAMITKDKKPFTYTPGMGGKLDLSQIRSPRMARRVAKNANDEGIEGPPKLVPESKPTAPTVSSLFVQPQFAVPVFPNNVPSQPNVNKIPQSSSNNKTDVVNRQAESSKTITKVDSKITPMTVTSNQSNTPESPTQITLVKAPTPWLQNKSKSQEEVPEWAKRADSNKTAGTLSECTAVSPTIYTQVQQSRQSPPQHAQMKTKEQQQSIQQSPRHFQHQTSLQCQKPQSTQQHQLQQQKQTSNPIISTSLQTNQHERIVPIRVEDRPSVFDTKRESGHHQFKQSPSLHHQQRWGRTSAHYSPEDQNQLQEQDQTHVSSRPEPSFGTYIIPLVIEGNDKKTTLSNNGSDSSAKAAKAAQHRGPTSIQQQEAGPIQSRSFRVLQKITDTSNDVGTEQVRKLELSEDERVLMNKFKEQVDHETYLHQEEDPRYRGAAIPSRAFRFLQNMTDSSDAPITCTAPRNIQNAPSKRQNRNSKSFEDTQANLPPSEQQVQEPRKYMGSAIPSRSFRILQAMTAPESIATQENRQADYTCRTENNLPGNQQDVFLPSRSVPFWHSEHWLDYYPVQYNALSDEIGADKFSFVSYPRYPDGNAYDRYEPVSPISNQNFGDLERISITRPESLSGRHGCAMVLPQLSSVHRPYFDTCFVHNDRHRNGSTNESVQINGRRVLPNEVNHAHWDEYIGNFNDSKERSCIIMAMNVTDEENGMPEHSRATASKNVETLGKTLGLHIKIPNYTYIDTSDSSASSDSSDSSNSNNFNDSISDKEHVLDSWKNGFGRNNDTDNTLSNSDSSFYLAYSTGLNSQGKPEGDTQRRVLVTSSDNDRTAAYPRLPPSIDNREYSTNDSESSEKVRKDPLDYSEDVDSCDTFEQKIAIKTRNDDCADDRSFSDKASSGNRGSHDQEYNNEDTPIEQPISDDHYDNERDGQNEIRRTDDSIDDAETTTMVSVSLPLKFKFFVSKDNEDITTVIIGDSKMKAEKHSRAKDEYPIQNDKKDDVCVSFFVGNDTSANFTVNKRDDARSAENKSIATPHVDFTLRKDAMKTSETNCEKQAKDTWGYNGDSIKSASRSIDDDRMSSESRDIVDQKNLLKAKNDNCITGSPCNLIENSTLSEPKIAECSSMKNDSQVQIVDRCSGNQADRENGTIARTNDDRYTSLFRKNTKHLPNVHSREDTDDEDSGVTSDVSRMISDTDSECTWSKKNSKKYQRTQTHSRLFRLLNDVSIPSDCSKVDSSFQKEYLSLPLNAFNCDDSYCSNYSSGLTSPECSPIYEQPSQRFHDATSASSPYIKVDHPASQPGLQSEQVFYQDDPYFQVWKGSKSLDSHEHDVVPSLAFKILDNKLPSWAYKVNVLCPRIKSTKSVPQTLLARQTVQTGKIDDPLAVPPIATCCAKTNVC